MGFLGRIGETSRKERTMYEPVTMTLPKTPWIRLTYLFSDDDVVRLGFGVLVFSCIKCGGFENLKYENIEELEKDVLGDHGHPELRAARDKFQRLHIHD